MGKLVISDVDGILTDGKVTYYDNGTLSRSFSVVDGYYISKLQSQGHQFVFVSGSDSPDIQLRLEKFVDPRFICLGVKRKLQWFHDFYEEYVRPTSLGISDIVFVCDGGNDVELAKYITEGNGRIICPEDADETLLYLRSVVQVGKRGSHLYQQIYEREILGWSI